MKRNYFIITVLFMGIALLLTGCFEQAKYTGGGSLDSSEGDGDKAIFGFVLNGCGCESIAEATGKFNYHDKAAISVGEKLGVKMKGDLYDVIDVTGPSNTSIVAYRSTNPFAKGEGFAKVTFTDLGEGTDEHGLFEIKVTSGPFDGYENEGIIQGNIQYHECD